MLTSRRHTIVFPSTGPKGIGVAAGLPGQYRNAGVQLMRETDEDAKTYRPQSSSGVVDPDFVRSAVTMGLGRNIVGISIAPDSQIASCDLWFGGGTDDTDRYHISAGNPWLGVIDATSADLRVSIPNGIPAIARANTVIAWDSTDTYVVNADDTKTATYGFPLRLEVWYADEPVHSLPRSEIRSELVAHAIAAIVDTVVNSCDFYVCVAGRRRVDVHVYPISTGAVALTVAAVEGFKQASENSMIDEPVATLLKLNEAGNTSVSCAQGANTIFSFSGNPFTLLRVRVDPSTEAESGIVQIKVIAQDY